MSRRALRRLRGEWRGQGLLGEETPVGGPEARGSDEDEDEDEEVAGHQLPPVSGGGRRRRGPRREPLERVANPFELINSEGLDEDLVSKEETDESRLQEGDNPTTEEAEPEGLESDKREDGGELEQLDQMSTANNKSRKKKKKRKNKKNPSGEALFLGDDDQVEDIESILLSIESSNGPPCQSQSRLVTDHRPLLYIEHRSLNPETELKRYFGARAVLGDQRRLLALRRVQHTALHQDAGATLWVPQCLAGEKSVGPGSFDGLGQRLESIFLTDVACMPRQRQRQYVRSTWLTAPKDTWPRHSKTGISMVLLETRRGEQHFTFEHNREYQLVQFKFLDAVESMDPNNLVLLLQMNPYHVDSLLQLSDVCRMQEDQEMARDLIERALYTLECAFHPVFSLTSGTCRLDYRHPENRAFYLALFKHLLFLERRGCPRTALEVCKLLLSLDPENDPLCMLLMVDLLSLRAREYAFLTRMFQEWEGHRNLSQLPNFAFSVPLAYFFLSQQEDLSEAEQSRAREQADSLIQQALIMFPSALMPLLDRCSVQPDPVVASHAFFGLEAQLSVPAALSQLVSLYLGRSHALWKETAIMAWLEANVHQVLRVVDAKEPVLEEAEQKRKARYQNAPRNVYRHVILSEIREATAALPPEVTSQPIMGFDPLPPLDSIVSYTRPERAAHPANESTLSLFFRSLLPNFNLQGEVRAGGEAEPGAGQNLNQGVNRLMAAMRDMLANIQFQEPPRDDNPEGDGGDWD